MNSYPLIFDSPQTMQEYCLRQRSVSSVAGLVPTMGALHEGHLSLIDYLRPLCQTLLVSIFVNPLQFNQKSDLDNYPRTWKTDLELCRAHKVDAIYAPSPENMYPPGFQTNVSLPEISRGLCGGHRPGHFDGVATVVLKLLSATLPHLAVFGEKDYQQLKLIQRMAKDLDLPTRVIGRPIVREADGLALSSRNVHLSPAERAQAPAIYQALLAARQLALSGENEAGPLLEAARARLESADLIRPEYLEIREAESLRPADSLKQPARLLAAAWLGNTRLIDNIALNY